MASVRQSIGRIFEFHYNLFQLFLQPQRFGLLLQGNDARMRIVNSFLLWNCYQCFYHTYNSFICEPPTIKHNLPLDEILQESLEISDDLLGDLYRYYSSE